MESAFRVIQGELHWPQPKFWNVEAEMISRHVAGDGETVADPDADLSNEERVQVSSPLPSERVQNR